MSYPIGLAGRLAVAGIGRIHDFWACRQKKKALKRPYTAILDLLRGKGHGKIPRLLGRPSQPATFPNLMFTVFCPRIPVTKELDEGQDMDAIVQIQPKLSKLIPMLASDQSGEVVSAAAAIGRILQSAGCDFHDLVNAIGTKPAGGFSGRVSSAGDWSSVGFPEMADFCCQHQEDLRPREAGFVRDMKIRLFLDSTFRLSPKQANWLRALHMKLRLLHS